MKATLTQPHHLPGLGTMKEGIMLEGLVEGDCLEVWLRSKVYKFPLEKLQLHPLPVTVVNQTVRRQQRKRRAQAAQAMVREAKISTVYKPEPEVAGKGDFNPRKYRTWL